MPEIFLFAGTRLRDYLAEKRAKAQRTLMIYDADLLLTSPEDDVVRFMVEVGAVEEVELHRGQVKQRRAEEVVKENDPAQDYRFKGSRRRVTRKSVVVPFTGDPTLLKLRPSGSTMGGPQVRIVGYDIILSSDNDYGPKTPQALRQHFEQDLDLIEQLLDLANAEIRAHNERLKAEYPEKVAARKVHHLKVKEMEAELGYPMWSEDDTGAHIVPITRRKIGPTRPAASNQPFAPEWTLADEQYEQALALLANYRNGFERNPSLTADAGEDQLRDLLLFNLNGHFHGQAVGEAFNRNGKTDILIRVDNRNVFIAECKIWDGPSKFREAIDQLLSYLVWRDTKAALLIFVRSSDLTGITAKAIEAITSHPNFKTLGPHADDDRHDFVLHPHGDPSREIKVALMLFQIPAKVDPSPGQQ